MPPDPCVGYLFSSGGDATSAWRSSSSSRSVLLQDRGSWPVGLCTGVLPVL